MHREIKMRFFVKEEYVDEKNHHALIEDADMVRHISKSLRMKEKEAIELCVEHKSIYDCEIESIAKSISCKIKSSRAIAEHRITLDLFQGIVKSNHWDYLIQKNVEFGITSITPVSTIRCVAKYEEKSEEKKMQRLQKIADSAAQQSFRDFIPKVNLPIDFSKLEQKINDYDLFMVAYENEKESFLSMLEKDLKSSSKIGIFIGPEGGFEESEIKRLEAFDKVRNITLGKRILRTESAGAYLLAQLNYILGL